MKFSIKDFYSKCDQILSFLRIWSYLLKKSLMENFIFCSAFLRRCLITLFKMGILGLLIDRGGNKKALLPNICHIFPTMMKLGTVIRYLKKIKKLYESRGTHFGAADIGVFSSEISKICSIKKKQI